MSLSFSTSSLLPLPNSSLHLRSLPKTSRKKANSHQRILHNSSQNNIILHSSHHRSPHPPLVPHSQIISFCQNKDLTTIPNNLIKTQNRKLHHIMKQINNTLSYKIQRRRGINNSTASIKELLEDGRDEKEYQQEIGRNKGVMVGLRRELEGLMARIKVVEDISYRVGIQKETEELEDEIRRRKEKLRDRRRKQISKEKRIEGGKWGNVSGEEEMGRLREEIANTIQHGTELKTLVSQVDSKNSKIIQKLQKLTSKQHSLQTQLSLHTHDLLISLTTQTNQLYLTHLTKLHKNKHRYQTSQDISKLKYYNHLKTLQGQVTKGHKIDESIREVDKEIRRRREEGEEISVSMSINMGESGRKREVEKRRNHSMLEYVEKDTKDRMLLTEVPEEIKQSGISKGKEVGKLKKMKCSNRIEFKKTVRSQKLLKSQPTPN